MQKPLEILKKKRAEAVNRILGKGYLAPVRVVVGMATCEIAAGSKEVFNVFKEAISKGLVGVHLSIKGCAGRCNLEPTIEIIEEGKFPYKYGLVTPQRAHQIIERHLKKREVIEEWLIQ